MLNIVGNTGQFLSLKRQFEKELLQQLKDAEEKQEKDTLNLKESLKRSSAILERGRSEERDSTLKGVEKYCHERRESRKNDLLNEGITERDAIEMVDGEFGEKDVLLLHECEVRVRSEEDRIDVELDNLLLNSMIEIQDLHASNVALIPHTLLLESVKKIDSLIAELREKEKEKIEELCDDGMDIKDATAQASEEYEINLLSGKLVIDEFTNERDIEMKESVRLKMESALNNLKNTERHARNILSDGLLNHKIRNEERLKIALEKKRLRRKTDLMQEGESELAANKIVDIEFEKDMVESNEKLEYEIKTAIDMIQECNDNNYDKKLSEIKLNGIKAIDGFENYLKCKEKESKKKLEERFHKKKIQREKQLLASGYSDKECSLIAESEYGECSSDVLEKMSELQTELENEKLAILEKSKEELMKNDMIGNLSAGERMEKEDDEHFSLLDDLTEKERIMMKNQKNNSLAIFEISQGVSRIAEMTGKDILELRSAQQKELNDLEDIYLSRKQNREEIHQDRIRLNSEEKEKELISLGMSEENARKKVKEEETLALSLEFEKLQSDLQAEFEVRNYPGI